MRNKTIAVAMSGGVDSSVAAIMLLEEGADIFGVTMRIHDYSDDSINSAIDVCKKLGIEHFVVDLTEKFSDKVLGPFNEFYTIGLTPNPCAFCNKDIKCDALLSAARHIGADTMATGHYARGGSHLPLQEATNKSKDQSYFLSMVDKKNLQSMVFPLGNILTKNEVRKIAQNYGLPNSDDKDSQNVCFLKEDYRKFLASEKGEIIHAESGKVLGHHHGTNNYTIGQRRGTGIQYVEPLYVTKIDYRRNVIYVGEKRLLYLVSEFRINNVNWILDMKNQFECFVKLRSSAAKIKARIQQCADSRCIVFFLEKNSETPVTPGQLCAMYDDCGNVIGAGTMSL